MEKDMTEHKLYHHCGLTLLGQSIKSTDGKATQPFISLQGLGHALAKTLQGAALWFDRHCCWPGAREDAGSHPHREGSYPSAILLDPGI